MGNPGKTSVLFGIAAWSALATNVVILAQMSQSDGSGAGFQAFLPVLLLSFATLVCLAVNLGLGIRAWTRAPKGSKPIAGLLIGAPLALFFLASILAEPFLG